MAPQIRAMPRPVTMLLSSTPPRCPPSAVAASTRWSARDRPLPSSAGLIAPHISTIKFARKAAVGSPPPGSTTTSTTIGPTGTTTPREVPNGKIAITDHSPCAGNSVGVVASGFVPKTAVSLQIDSPAHPLGVLTADGSGRVSTVVQLPANGPTGPHKLVASGIQPGGKSLTVSTQVNIKVQGDCDTTTGSQGSTPSSVDVSGDTSTPTTSGTGTGGTGGTGGGASSGGGTLAFTGTDSTRLALLGAGAAVIGRVVYGAANAGRDEDQEDRPDA